MDEAVKKIEELREERNINKNVFAKNIGMSTMAYSRLSTGKTKLKVDTLIRVANFFEIEDYNFFFKKQLTDYVINCNTVKNETPVTNTTDFHRKPVVLLGGEKNRIKTNNESDIKRKSRRI